VALKSSGLPRWQAPEDFLAIRLALVEETAVAKIEVLARVVEVVGRLPPQSVRQVEVLPVASSGRDSGKRRRVVSKLKLYLAATSGNHRSASRTKLICASSCFAAKNAMTLNFGFASVEDSAGAQAISAPNTNPVRAALMKGRIRLTLFLAVAMSACSLTNRSSDGSCDKGIAVAVRTLDASTVIDESLIGSLLRAGTARCSSNVEFMEAYNEALFMALEKNPAGFIRQFARVSDHSFVLERLESPVNDAISPSRVIAKLANLAVTEKATYNKVVAALKIAERKQEM